MTVVQRGITYGGAFRSGLYLLRCSCDVEFVCGEYWLDAALREGVYVLYEKIDAGIGTSRRWPEGL